MIAALVAGCGNDTKPAPPAAPPLEDRALATIDRLADLFVADGSDCDKLADDVTAFAADHHDVFTAIQQMTPPEGSAREAFEARNAARMDAIQHKIAGAVQTCATNARLGAAIAALMH